MTEGMTRRELVPVEAGRVGTAWVGDARRCEAGADANTDGVMFSPSSLPLPEAASSASWSRSPAKSPNESAEVAGADGWRLRMDARNAAANRRARRCLRARAASWAVSSDTNAALVACNSCSHTWTPTAKPRDTCTPHDTINGRHDQQQPPCPIKTPSDPFC